MRYLNSQILYDVFLTMQALIRETEASELKAQHVY